MQMTARDRRMLQVLGAVGGLALVFYLVTNVFGGGGEDAASPTGPTGVIVPISPSLTPSPTPEETLPPVVLAGARDPFAIPAGLVTGATTTSPGATTSPGTTGGTVPGTSTTTTTGGTTTSTSTTTTTSGTTTTTTSTGTTTTTTTATTTTSPGGGGGGGDGDEEPPPNKIRIGGHNLILLDTDDKRDEIEIKVDGRVYTVEEGARFDENFRLVQIDGECARFLFGDQSFNLCRPQR